MTFPLIISSPSGGGKTTVVNAVLARFKGADRVVTATSRAPRSGEKNGKDYFFWTDRQFESAIKKNAMLEWAKVFNTFYGVPKKSVDAILKKRLIPILVIDVQGEASVKKLLGGAVSVFLMPPSMAELKKRILKRGDGTKNISLRLKTAKSEIARAKDFDYIVVNNKLETAVDDVLSIIRAETLRSKKCLKTKNSKVK